MFFSNRSTGSTENKRKIIYIKFEICNLKPIATTTELEGGYNDLQVLKYENIM